MIKEAGDRLAVLLRGEIPPRLDQEALENDEERRLAVLLNDLVCFMQEVHRFIIPLSRGELRDLSLQRGNFLSSPFKELHSRLSHLTWQAKQVAEGDYEQRVDFMGDFSEAFNSMIVSLEQKEKLLKNKIRDLENALAHIEKLEGILPICSVCKSIRVEGADPYQQESWKQIECYLSERTEVAFSHSLCPNCVQKLYPDLASRNSRRSDGDQ